MSDSTDASIFTAVAASQRNPGFEFGNLRTREYRLHVLGLTQDGTMWHTIRGGQVVVEDQEWWPGGFGNVSEVVGAPGSFTDVAASCDDDDRLHVLGLTQDGIMWHTIRLNDRAWSSTGFGNVSEVVGAPGPFTDVAASCDHDDDRLHVLGLTQDGTMWHTIRLNDRAWSSTGFGNVSEVVGAPGPFTDVAASCDHDDRLHVLGLTQDGTMWHTIRLNDRAWSSTGFGNVSEVVGAPGPFTDVAASCDHDDRLHVLGLTQDGTMWHTIRLNDRAWSSTGFGNVSEVVGAPGPFTDVAASSEFRLHVMGLTQDGTMWHTIRLNDQAWQSTGFGNVSEVVGWH
ncbi:hypothetical protein [Actinomycetospora cinnamomea]|uniref:Uncharacterized protein n=1 Tax=Actinomycetospora cinnamomea TaxID=663609 RepID=A0A2U1F7P3_9PSEU|nr:hypothetical protein [Actinomycetospora cinnamomea]PVZ08188.1 hypothetical protein C8D89_10971 [Actinomycetospora cinnamomea]